MKICMVGAGYVGLVSAACFSDFGWTVTCVDKDPDRLSFLHAVRVIRRKLPLFFAVPPSQAPCLA